MGKERHFYQLITPIAGVERECVTSGCALLPVDTGTQTTDRSRCLVASRELHPSAIQTLCECKLGDYKLQDAPSTRR